MRNLAPVVKRNSRISFSKIRDFAAAFGVGENDTTISTVDADGVALAAVQGLYQEDQQLKRDLAPSTFYFRTLTSDF
jgi:hypothetical protein